MQLSRQVRIILSNNHNVKSSKSKISEAEKQADTLRALAEQGNIDAQQSLAEQQEFIKKKNREKLEEEKGNNEFNWLKVFIRHTPQK